MQIALYRSVEIEPKMRGWSRPVNKQRLQHRRLLNPNAEVVETQGGAGHHGA